MTVYSFCYEKGCRDGYYPVGGVVTPRGTSTENVAWRSALRWHDLSLVHRPGSVREGTAFVRQSGGNYHDSGHKSEGRDQRCLQRFGRLIHGQQIGFRNLDHGTCRRHQRHGPGRHARRHAIEQRRVPGAALIHDLADFTAITASPTRRCCRDPGGVRAGGGWDGNGGRVAAANSSGRLGFSASIPTRGITA